MARALGDVEAEARLSLKDFVVVVVISEICGAELGSGIEFAESFERDVCVERALRRDEKVGLPGARIVAVYLAGIPYRRRHTLFEDHELVEVAIGRARDRKDEEELHWLRI